jgi:hypothetical protein
VAKATLVHLTDFLADLKVDAMRPFLTARASTTKNRKEAVIPLHPSLAQELRGAKGELTEEAARVFKLSKNISRSFGQDLQRGHHCP